MAAAAATPTTLRPAAMTVTLEGTRRAEMAQRPEMARSPRMRWRLGATMVQRQLVDRGLVDQRAQSDG